MNRRIPLAVSALTATAMLMGTGASGASSAPSERSVSAAAPAPRGGKCIYKGYGGWGFPELVTRKGAGTPKYKYGYTKRYRRSLQLNTGKLHDRSAATLKYTRKGDKVWVTISHSKGKNWASCGHKTAKRTGDVITSTKYLHSGSDVKNRYMRACAKTDGKVWCADIGNKKNTNHSDNKKRYWWTDS
ncbi:hypothetical protein ACFW4X_08640 [Streptomyces smyrnaeus]|uniref:hypothetical protein n=1 Tax=Streptomyces smyrnaeus TaxID=1387713 RepID=UPI003683A073